MANYNFKGRPPGTNKVKITDPILKEYYIVQDEWSYNLVKKNNASESVMGYYHDLPAALIGASKYLQLDGKEKTLEGYINKLNNKLDELRSII
jgi:hypothetical protein